MPRKKDVAIGKCISIVVSPVTEPKTVHTAEDEEGRKSRMPRAAVSHCNGLSKNGDSG